VNTNLDVAKLCPVDKKDLRRAKLRLWTNKHGVPAGEKSYFSQIFAGGSFGERAARRLERDYNMGAGYLDDPEMPEGTGNVVEIGSRRGKVEVVQIPQYSGIGGSMGKGLLLRDQPGEIQQWTVTPEWVQKNVPSCTGIENLAIVTGFGPSMRGMFNPGDPLLVDRGVKSVEYDAVYFFRVGDEGFIKILQRVPGVGLRAISKNTEFETWTITPDMDFEVFARVLKVWQSEDF
jgi:hypothetical protein